MKDFIFSPRQTRQKFHRNDGNICNFCLKILIYFDFQIHTKSERNCAPSPICITKLKIPSKDIIYLQWSSIQTISETISALFGKIGQFIFEGKHAIILTHQVNHCQTSDCSPPPALLSQCDLLTEDSLQQDGRSMTVSYGSSNDDVVHSSLSVMWSPFIQSNGQRDVYYSIKNMLRHRDLHKIVNRHNWLNLICP